MGQEQPPLIIMMDAMKGQRLSDRDYHYWRQKALEYSNGITGVNEKTPQKQAERNPAGRTGLKGKGALPRWGPNHYVLFVISRYQKSKTSLSQGRGLEIALMRIFRTDQFVLPGDFVPGEQKYDGVMRVCFKIPDNVSISTADDVTTFFNSCLQHPPDQTDTTNVLVECSVARKGYMDDPMNTDNCWREVELWKVHFSCKENLAERFQPNVIWRLVTDDLFLKLPSGHSSLFNENDFKDDVEDNAEDELSDNRKEDVEGDVKNGV
ncbi:protein ced-11-like isoform X2 [Ixodes scapularis]